MDQADLKVVGLWLKCWCNNGVLDQDINCQRKSCMTQILLEYMICVRKYISLGLIVRENCEIEAINMHFMW